MTSGRQAFSLCRPLWCRSPKRKKKNEKLWGINTLEDKGTILRGQQAAAVALAVAVTTLALHIDMLCQRAAIQYLSPFLCLCFFELL